MENYLGQIAERWDKVEHRIKEAELLSRAVHIPAINELRYAGRQLVDAMIKIHSSSVGEEEKRTLVQKHIIVAEQYIRNADHDISDALIDFIKNRIDSSLEKYGMATIVAHFPYIGEMRDLVQKADGLIADSRRDRTKRDENYSTIYNTCIIRLMELFHKFKEKEPSIIYDALVVEKKYKASRMVNHFYGVTTLVSAVLAILFYIMPWSELKVAVISKLGP